MAVVDPNTENAEILYSELAPLVKDVQQLYSQTQTPLTLDETVVTKFIHCLEKVFFYGIIEITLWEIVEEYLVEDEMVQEYIDQVEYSGCVDTDLGKSRALLRLCLKDKKLEDFFLALAEGETSTEYKSWALIKTKCGQLVAIFKELSEIEFNIEITGDLDDDEWELANKTFLHASQSVQLDLTLGESFREEDEISDSDDFDDDDFGLDQELSGGNGLSDGETLEVLTNPVPLFNPARIEPKKMKHNPHVDYLAFADHDVIDDDNDKFSKYATTPLILNKCQTTPNLLTSKKHAAVHSQPPISTSNKINYSSDEDAPLPPPVVSAPPVIIKKRMQKNTISLGDVQWEPWSDPPDDYKLLPSLCVENYNLIRRKGILDFSGTLHKRGVQMNDNWQIRYFTLDGMDDTDLFIRYYGDQDKVERGLERGRIDVYSILDITTEPASKESFILITLKTPERIYELSSNALEVVASLIGVIKNIKDNIRRKNTLQLVNEVIVDENYVTMNGEMYKMGKVHRGWKKRFFRLDTRMDLQLRYYENENSKNEKGSISLVYVNCVTNTTNDNILKSKPHCFDIITENRTFHVAATTPERRDAWVAALQKAIGRTPTFDGGEEPIYKGPVKKHSGLSRKSHFFKRAFTGASRKMKSMVNNGEGFLVLTQDHVFYFNDARLYDKFQRVTLRGDKYNFNEGEMKLDLPGCELFRITGYPKDAERFALLKNGEYYVFSARTKREHKLWVKRITETANITASIMPKY